MGEPIGLRKISVCVTVMWKSKMGTWLRRLAPSIAKEAVSSCGKHDLPSRWHCQINHVKLAPGHGETRDLQLMINLLL